MFLSEIKRGEREGGKQQAAAPFKILEEFFSSSAELNDLSRELTLGIVSRCCCKLSQIFFSALLCLFNLPHSHPIDFCIGVTNTHGPVALPTARAVSNFFKYGPNSGLFLFIFVLF